jgi:hypothetical protein
MAMYNIQISKDQARQIALEIFDDLLQGITEQKEKEAKAKPKSGSNEQSRKERRAA